MATGDRQEAIRYVGHYSTVSHFVQKDSKTEDIRPCEYRQGGRQVQELSWILYPQPRLLVSI